MSYGEALGTLGDNTERVILQLWEAVGRGEIDAETFRDLAATLVARANAHGVILADLTLAGVSAAATGLPVVVSSVPSAHYTDPDRLARALGTILGTEGDRTERLARLARSEPVETSQRAFTDGIKRSPLTEGWVRDLNGDACQLCTWWWRDGRVWPKDHEMPTHKGCRCVPVPTFRERVQDTEAIRRQRRRAEAQANRDRFDQQMRERTERP